MPFTPPPLSSAVFTPPPLESAEAEDPEDARIREVFANQALVPRTSDERAESDLRLAQQAGLLTGVETPQDSLAQYLSKRLSLSPRTVRDALDTASAALRAPVSRKTFGDIIAEKYPERPIGTVPQVLAGAQNIGANIAGSFADPVVAASILATGGLAAGGLGKFVPIANRLISGAFAADMLHNAPEQARQAGMASVSGTPFEKTTAYGSLGLTAALAPSLASHALRPKIPQAKLQRIIQEAQLPDQFVMQPPTLQTRRLGIRGVDPNVLNPALESWADGKIKNAGTQFDMGADPSLAAAGVIKGTAILERGVRDRGAWGVQMIKAFGNEITPHLERLYAEAQQQLERGVPNAITERPQSAGNIPEHQRTAPRSDVFPNETQVRSGQGQQTGGGNRPERVAPGTETAFPEKNVTPADIIAKPRGDPAIDHNVINSLSNDDAATLFTVKGEGGAPAYSPQAGSVMWGAKQGKGVLPELMKMDKEATSAARDALLIQLDPKSTPEQRVVAQRNQLANEGKGMWFRGAIEGVNRFGGNYEAAVKDGLITPETGVASPQQKLADALNLRSEGPTTSPSGKTIWSFSITKEGAAKDATFSVPEGATQAQIASKLAEVEKSFGPEMANKAAQSATGPELAVESVTPLEPASGSPLSAIDSLINRLESAKFAQPTGQQLFSLPHPEAVSQIGKTAWNNAVDVAIAAVKAGRTVTVALDEALSYIKANAKDFDEAKLRTNLTGLLREETPRASGQAGGGGSSGAPPPSAGPTQFPSGEEQMRKLSARATTAPEIPAPVQQRIATAPESVYPQQSVSRVVDHVKTLSDAELNAVLPTNEIYTAAKMEQANRLFNAGQNDAGYAIYAQLSEQLTRFGQIVNQAKLLHGLMPENVVKVVNETLIKAGRDPLTPEQAAHLQGLSRARIDGQRALDASTAEWMRKPTDENAAKAEAELVKANQAALAEQRFAHKYQPRTLPALLKSILQGNLLTPISEVANLIGNVSFVPFRGQTRSLAAGIDTLDAYLRTRPRKVMVRPVTGSAEAVKGLIRGMKEIPGVLLHGGDIIKGEKRASLHPLEAWVKQFSRNPEMPTVRGRVPLIDRVKLAIEGTFGVPAEIMLRGLAAGDLPPMRAARARLIAEQAGISKLAPNQMAMAQKFPELFFNKEQMKIIESETRRDLFQRESETLQHFTSLLGKKGGWFDLAVAFHMPYKLTPWNIISEVFSYNPIIALGKTAIEAKRGNIREAETAAAKVVVGSMLVGAGTWLYKKGLLAPSLDQRDEAQKARILSSQVLPPNHINISGLKRALSGGDPTFRPNDTTVDMFRAGGLAGSMFYMAANIGRDLEKKAIDPATAATSLIRNSFVEQARFGVNQSFLKGMSSVLQAVTSGDVDNYIQGLENAVISIPIPNSLSTLGRVRRQYKVDLHADTIGKEFSNMVRFRLGEKNLDEYLPLRRGLWGEPMPETPKGRNGILYWFFDISKGQQVTDDPLPLELYRLWRKTSDTSVIPSLPERNLTFANQTFLLSPAQKSELAELVGTQRRDIADKLVVNPDFHKLSDEYKISILARAYGIGQRIGKAQFYQLHQDDLKLAPTKPGFELMQTQ